MLDNAALSSLVRGSRMHPEVAPKPQVGPIRQLRRRVEKEIRDQYLDEGKGAPFRHQLQLGLKIRLRIWFTFLRRCPSVILHSKS
jgi:hypothetical protein